MQLDVRNNLSTFFLQFHLSLLIFQVMIFLKFRGFRKTTNYLSLTLWGKLFIKSRIIPINFLLYKWIQECIIIHWEWATAMWVKENCLLWINFFCSGVTLRIIRIVGQIIFKAQNYSNTFSASQVNTGMYYYSLRLNDGNVSKGKLLVVN